MKNKSKRKNIQVGDEGEPLSKCMQCKAYYLPKYAEATGGHECNNLILGLLKMREVEK